MAAVVGTKAQRRKKLGDRAFDRQHHRKKDEVIYGLGAVGKVGLLECARPCTIDYSELQAWVIENMVALREVNQA